MKFEQLVPVLADVPHTRPHRGKILYDFVLLAKPTRILELGCAHGVAACYMAAALDELGASGQVHSLDLLSAFERKPNIHELGTQLGLEAFLRVDFKPYSYTWRLKELIEEHTEGDRCVPVYDFVFIDGSHSWQVDGLAFFLAEKLLKPGGYVLFDDLYWTLNELATLPPDLASLTPEETNVPHVERVFSLCVAQHPSFTDVLVEDGWGWARKREEANKPLTPTVLKSVYDDLGWWPRFVATVNRYRKGANRRQIAAVNQK